MKKYLLLCLLLAGCSSTPEYKRWDMIIPTDGGKPYFVEASEMPTSVCVNNLCYLTLIDED